jgi:hypothetical protein
MNRAKAKRRRERIRAKEMALASGWYKEYFGMGLRLWFNNRFHVW